MEWFVQMDMGLVGNGAELNRLSFVIVGKKLRFSGRIYEYLGLFRDGGIQTGEGFRGSFPCLYAIYGFRRANVDNGL